MTLIRCSGHKFNGKSDNPYGVTNYWECAKCKLKVYTQQAANFLSGRTS